MAVQMNRWQCETVAMSLLRSELLPSDLVWLIVHTLQWIKLLHAVTLNMTYKLSLDPFLPCPVSGDPILLRFRVQPPCALFGIAHGDDLLAQEILGDAVPRLVASAIGEWIGARKDITLPSPVIRTQNDTHGIDITMGIQRKGALLPAMDSLRIALGRRFSWVGLQSVRSHRPL